MRDQHEMRWGKANWIIGAVVLLVWLLIHALFPNMDNKYVLLIALLAAIAAAAVIYAVKKKKKEKEDEEKLPPL